MTSRRRSSLTSKSHQVGGDLSWMVRAACKRLGFGFLSWAPVEVRKVCRDCPVRRDCHEAGLMPRQIGAMP